MRTTKSYLMRVMTAQSNLSKFHRTLHPKNIRNLAFVQAKI